jgi:superfamily II RNA helicase
MLCWPGHRANLSLRSGKLEDKIESFYANNFDSKMTDVYEGSLIRLFRRLEELLRQMAQAGKVMGSDELSAKFEESLSKIRRDIVAAQSLYL